MYREDKYLEAKARLNKLKGFYHHLFWYIAVNVFIVTMVYINSENIDDFWNYGTFSTAFFWGIGVVFHAVCVFGKNLIFSKSWEERRIKEYMEKNKF